MRHFLATFFWLLLASAASAQVLTVTRQGTSNVFDYSWSLPKTVPNNGSTPGTAYNIYLYHVAEGAVVVPPNVYHSGASTVIDSLSSLSVTKSGSGTFTLPAGRTLYAFTQSLTYGVTPTTRLASSLDGFPYFAGTQTALMNFDGNPLALEKGQSMTGTVTGAQSINPYNFAVVSGPVTISGNATTGEYVVTSNGTEGPWQVKAWISEGNGYSRSPDASILGATVWQNRYKISVPLDNSTSFKVAL